ncbi:MAG: Crp/Fnr family transcriptional regulator, partial [Bacteroidota bacterium]
IFHDLPGGRFSSHDFAKDAVVHLLEFINNQRSEKYTIKNHLLMESSDKLSPQAILQNLAPISQKDWEQIQPQIKQEQIARHEFFVRPGQTCDRVAIIILGLFRLFYQTEEGDKNMLFFAEGQFMTDYFSYLTQTPSIRPIQALEDSLVVSIPKTAIDHLFQTNLSWANLGRQMAESAYLTAVQRGNRLLHDDFDTRFDTFIQEQPSLLNRVPQYMIASYLNMTPETFSRIKKRRFKTQSAPNSIHDPLEPPSV